MAEIRSRIDKGDTFSGASPRSEGAHDGNEQDRERRGEQVDELNNEVSEVLGQIERVLTQIRSVAKPTPGRADEPT